MDESLAWLHQAVADRLAAEREFIFAAAAATPVWCHAIAKCQQAVEKSVKAIVAALIAARRWRGPPIGFVHEVGRHMGTLVRLPRSSEFPLLRRHLLRLFDPNTRSTIEALECLIPKAPPPGQPLRRNTEYPYHDATGGFTYPAEPSIFSRTEIERFRALSSRLTDSARKIVAMLRRSGS